jgi:protein-S-isoprenylcysteine O-methyltransferase Ste14
VILRSASSAALRPGVERGFRVVLNLAGAAGAAFFARATLESYLQTHRLIGAAFFAEQMWFVVAFLVRRPARASSARLRDWALAFAGTFGGVLLRPAGLHPPWGVAAGLGLQLAGLVICLASLVALGRSFGFVAADRGLVTRGPYAIVRHPVYAAYVIIQAGYVLQSVSVRNIVVVIVATGCNVGRALAEERLLAACADYADYRYADYRARVRWRLFPWLW